MNVRKQIVSVVWCAALATAIVPAVAAGTASASPVIASTGAAPKPGTWTRITPTGIGNTEEIGLVRGGDGVLHVLWTAGTAPGTYRVLDTPIAANGSVERTVAVVSHFYGASDPDGAAIAGGVGAFWNGQQSGSPGSRLGTYEATRPSRGGSWHLSPAPAAAVNPYWGDTISATTGADGKPWVAFTVSGGIAVRHFGHTERMIGISSCCQYYPGIGTDGKTGQTWLTYFSNGTGLTGTYYQPFSSPGAPSAGAKRAPGSVTGGNALSALQRVTAVGRGHGRPGVYITYLSGYSFPRAVDLYRLGAKTAMTVTKLPALNNIGLSTLAADPLGRICVVWASTINGQSALYVRRSNNAVTGFGGIGKVRLPAGTSDIWRVYINAQPARVDVVALLTVHGALAYWTTQVLPPK